MRVKLKFRQEVAERDAEERARGERHAPDVQVPGESHGETFVPIQNRATPAGIIRANPRLTR